MKTKMIRARVNQDIWLKLKQLKALVDAKENRDARISVLIRDCLIIGISKMIERLKD